MEIISIRILSELRAWRCLSAFPLSPNIAWGNRSAILVANTGNFNDLRTW